MKAKLSNTEQDAAVRRQAFAAAKKKLQDTEFPFSIGTSLKVVSLGSLKKRYHDKRYLLPVGYKTERIYYCCFNPAKRAKYTNLIIDGGKKARYSVAHESGKATFVGNSTKEAWSKLLAAVNASCASLGLPSKAKTISGPTQFGFACDKIHSLLEGLPGSVDCKNYTFQEVPVEGNTAASKFYKTQSVIAMWEQDHQFYEANIVKVNTNGTCDVRFTDGVLSLSVPNQFIRQIDTGTSTDSSPRATAAFSSNKRTKIPTAKQQALDVAKRTKKRPAPTDGGRKNTPNKSQTIKKNTTPHKKPGPKPKTPKPGRPMDTGYAKRLSMSLERTSSGSKDTSAVHSPGKPKLSPSEKRRRLMKSVSLVLSQILHFVGSNLEVGNWQCKMHLDSASVYSKIDNKVKDSVVFESVVERLQLLHKDWDVTLTRDLVAIKRGDVGVCLEITVK